MFRCVDIGSNLGHLLDADFSKQCFAGVHADYVPFAIFSVIFYLIGLPFGTFVVLFLNRKRLDQPQIESKYGDLYRQYDPEWYFWECLLMIQKCFLTGAMCAIAPGSPIQLLVALVLCVSYLLLVLHANPYKGEIEDTLAFLTSLCLSASLLFGLVLIMDKPNDPVFDVMLLGHVLIAINVFPFFYVVYAIMKVVLSKGTIQNLEKGTDQSSINGRKRRRRSSVSKVPNLSRQKTMALVGKAVTHEAVNKTQREYVEARNAAVAKIKRREKEADARVRKRLAERRRTKVKPTTVIDVTPKRLTTWSLEELPEDAKDKTAIQELRSLLRVKIQSPDKLAIVFNKLDADGNKQISKTDFQKLVCAVAKKNKKLSVLLKTERFGNMLWMSVASLRKSGDGEGEIDLSTLSHWFFDL